MARIEQSTTVSAPPEKAFDYLADIARHTEWGSHIASAEKASDAPIAAGSTFTTVGKLFGIHRAEVKIAELVPNQKIVYESQDDSGHFRHEFTPEPRRRRHHAHEERRGAQDHRPAEAVLAPPAAPIAPQHGHGPQEDQGAPGSAGMMVPLPEGPKGFEGPCLKLAVHRWCRREPAARCLSCRSRD